MGNKPTSAKRRTNNTTTDNSSEVTDRDKSATTSSGAQPQQQHKTVDHTPSVGGRADVDGKQLHYNLYRSYSQLGHNDVTARPSVSATLTPDIKVYRRSSSRTQVLSAAGRSMSLPRSFGRPSHFTELQSDEFTASRNADSRIRRTSSRASTISNSYTLPNKPVSGDDFPSTDLVRRRLEQFEKNFVSTVVDNFSSLPIATQLSCLAIAINKSQQTVSLANYFQLPDNSSPQLPVDFLDQCLAGFTDFVPCVPPAMFPGITHARKLKGCDIMQLTSLCRDIITLVAAEAAAEVARMFEYQLSILLGGSQASSVALLAQHCAERAIEYCVKVCHSINRNSIMQGAVRGRPPKSASLIVSAAVGQRELKWNLFEIVTRPALRRDRLLTEAELQHETVDESSPWQFFSSKHSNAMLYGYRGQMIDWDYTTGSYKLNKQDEAMFTEEVPSRYDDVHRQYCPYVRLIGVSAIKLYLSSSSTNSQRLDQYLLRMSRDAGFKDRDVILPAYRPLKSAVINVPVTCDIGRIDAPKQLLAATKTSTETHFPADSALQQSQQILSDNQQRNTNVRHSTNCYSPHGPVQPSFNKASTDHNRNINRSRVQQTGV